MDEGIRTQVAPPKLAAGSERPGGSAASSSPVSGVSSRETAPIVFFDGVCGLCNRFIDFVIHHDRTGAFRFAPLQGETARGRLPEPDVRDINSVVLWEEQAISRKSTAVVRILIGLGGGWRIVGGLLRVVPRPLRDAGYSLVARYRYAVFGKKQTCRLPTPAERAHFLP